MVTDANHTIQQPNRLRLNDRSGIYRILRDIRA